jgi:nucleoside-diphosphate-sugar epimerase
VKLLVTGARGFLGSRLAALLEELGNEVVRVARPGGADRAEAPVALELDVGDPAVRGLLSGCDAVLHFAGIPDPARCLADPARAVRENVGTTLNLLEGCLEHGCGLVYPSTVRAGVEPPPDPYAHSKRLGEEACRLHPARATAVRLTSVFGPGQVAWEGATGAISTFAARALEGSPIVIPGDPDRVRDFVYVDDIAPALAALVTEGRWNETLELASGVATPLRRAAELVSEAAGAGSRIEAGGGGLAPGEDESYEASGALPRVRCAARPLDEAVLLYVNWLRRHPAAEGRSIR